MSSGDVPEHWRRRGSTGSTSSSNWAPQRGAGRHSRSLVAGGVAYGFGKAWGATIRVQFLGTVNLTLLPVTWAVAIMVFPAWK